MKRVAAIAGLGLAAGCSSTPPEMAIQLTVGHEMDAMRAAPAVTSVRVDAVSSGKAVASATATPGGALDFGQLDQSTTLSFEATGSDAKGKAVLRGRSLSGIVVGEVGVVPLFVQRTGGWARPPMGLSRAHVGAPAAVYGERYLLTTGGASAADASGTTGAAATEFYDLFSLSPADATPFPRIAKSLVMQSSLGVVISDDGASAIDFSAQNAAELPLPSGLQSFAEVAGGRAIDSTSGTIYVVGATRAGPATDAVLAVDASGGMTAIRLGTPRAGAAAAWIPGVGLVVAGGSDKGPGVEVLASSGTSFGARAFPADATVGAALVTTGGDKPLAALVGGVLAGKSAATRTFDAGCPSSCVQMAIATATLPIALTEGWAFALAPGRWIALGSELGGQELNRTFVVDIGLGTVTELPLREPRSGATPVPAPNATLALVGGKHPDGTPALNVETFFPE